MKTGDLIFLEISGQESVESVGKLLPFTYHVTEAENRNLSRHVKIIIIDDSGERTVIDQLYAPGAVIDLERKGVHVFGQTQVIVLENGEKLLEKLYK